ncbi:MAG: hypothetical protein GX489_08825 [Firmicutes bacterium]|nr:hypothetical protein [Bacillota bacterium]
MRRLLPVSLALVLILVLSPLVRAQIATVNSDPEYGFIQVTLDKKLLTAKIKVLIEKNDDRYFYAMNHQQERFPLQLGTGIYKVHILEQVEGNKYKFIQSEELNIRSLVGRIKHKIISAGKNLCKLCTEYFLGRGATGGNQSPRTY